MKNYTITINYDDSEFDFELNSYDLESAIATAIAEVGRNDWTSYVIVHGRQEGE